MPAFEILATFLLATAVFAYIPGPAMIYTAAQTLALGRRAGFMAALGIHVGGYAHVIAAALGLSYVFHTVPTLYFIIKLAGALYLCWLGLRLILDRTQTDMVPAGASRKSAKRAFLDSVIVEVLNPKTAIFFIAFLPQFSDATAALPIWAQLMVFGTIANLMFTSADVVCVFLAGFVARRMRSSSAARNLLRQTAGVVLIGLGLNLIAKRA
jgi:threonine/homoserine/homoserine lactone efflux protein